MLDLQTLARIRLTLRPRSQMLIANTMLALNYGWLPGVGIALEGAENVPSEPVIFAMNHTDRFNYWPFQYQLYRQLNRFTATWVKGKYYENAVIARFMEWTNNIPTVSRGYLITRDFISTCNRRPNDAEYAALRNWVNAVAKLRGAESDAEELVVPDREAIPTEILETPREMLGRRFDPSGESYAEAINALFRQMMQRFVALNLERRELGLDLLVFPQGTRSKRLSRGHVGLAQIALHLRQPIVPVGCSGSDLAYPSSSPWAKRSQIVYRIGAPMSYESFAEYHVPPFEPFTPEAEWTHRDAFQGLVDRVMGRINELVDEPYRLAEGLDSDGVSGSDRFV